ncbi:MAG: hypothetical protein LIQ31_14800 [Planctomycetes bacterium]|nr:hypothetical protein [Planctomycetota bacterium]
MINTRMFNTTRLFGNRAKASLSPWTVAAYFLAVILFFLLVEAVIRNNTHIKEMAVERLLLEKTTAIQETIDKYFYKTQTLAALVVQKEADYNFEEVAAAVLDSDIIQNITIAPDGIISQVYPREGNEPALGLDFSREGPATGRRYWPGKWTISSWPGRSTLSRAARAWSAACRSGGKTSPEPGATGASSPSP